MDAKRRMLDDLKTKTLVWVTAASMIASCAAVLPAIADDAGTSYFPTYDVTPTVTGSDGAGLAADRNLYSSWTIKGTGEATYDLCRDTKIDTIGWWASDVADGSVITVEYSSDGSTWQKAYGSSLQSGRQELDDFDLDLPDDLTAHYLKFTVQSDSAKMRTINVVGSMSADSDGKPASMDGFTGQCKLTTDREVYKAGNLVGIYCAPGEAGKQYVDTSGGYTTTGDLDGLKEYDPDGAGAFEVKRTTGAFAVYTAEKQGDFTLTINDQPITIHVNDADYKAKYGAVDDDAENTSSDSDEKGTHSKDSAEDTGDDDVVKNDKGSKSDSGSQAAQADDDENASGKTRPVAMAIASIVPSLSSIPGLGSVLAGLSKILGK